MKPEEEEIIRQLTTLPKRTRTEIFWPQGYSYTDLRTDLNKQPAEKLPVIQLDSKLADSNWVDLGPRTKPTPEEIETQKQALFQKFRDADFTPVEASFLNVYSEEIDEVK